MCLIDKAKAVLQEVYYDTLKKDYPGLNVGWFIKKPISTQQLVKEIKSKLNP